MALKHATVLELRPHKLRRDENVPPVETPPHQQEAIDRIESVRKGLGHRIGDVDARVAALEAERTHLLDRLEATEALVRTLAANAEHHRAESEWAHREILALTSRMTAGEDLADTRWYERSRRRQIHARLLRDLGRIRD